MSDEDYQRLSQILWDQYIATKHRVEIVRRWFRYKATLVHLATGQEMCVTKPYWRRSRAYRAAMEMIEPASWEIMPLGGRVAAE